MPRSNLIVNVALKVKYSPPRVYFGLACYYPSSLVVLEFPSLIAEVYLLARLPLSAADRVMQRQVPCNGN